MNLPDRLRRALADNPAPELLAGDRPELSGTGGGRPAAVLVAITDRAQPGVLLTQRTNSLRKHAGQIAFPGGSRDFGEDDVMAALREAHEEIGITPGSVNVIGPVDRYRTITGFDVTPIVGVVPPDLVLTPQESEVADVFEAPFDFLMDPENQLLRTVHWEGRDRTYYEIPWNGRRIWGATAAMLVNLSRRLQWPK